MSRPFGDHGTAQQAMDWALDHNDDGEIEAGTFLRRWREGRLDEWPDFYVWLDGSLSPLGGDGKEEGVSSVSLPAHVGEPTATDAQHSAGGEG